MKGMGAGGVGGWLQLAERVKVEAEIRFLEQTVKHFHNNSEGCSGHYTDLKSL